MTDGTLCERAAETTRHIHLGNHPRANVDVSWIDEYCAPDARPDGRETAALRLWELHTRLDRIAFDLGERPDDALRAVAVRLKNGSPLVLMDLRRIESWVRGINEAPGAAETREVLSQAADILQPFAEGRR